MKHFLLRLINTMLKLISYVSYILSMCIGLFFEILFDLSNHNLINENAKRKLTDYFREVMLKEGITIDKLTTVYKIAYETQTSPFKLWALKRGAITLNRLRDLGIFFEHYQSGEELIGSCFKLNIIPLPSIIILNKNYKSILTKNIDCGFVYGYFVPSFWASFFQWMGSRLVELVGGRDLIKRKEILEKGLRIISSNYIEMLFKSIFAYRFIKDAADLVATNLRINIIIKKFEDKLIPYSLSQVNHLNSFVYKTRLKSLGIDSAQDQKELRNNIVKYADEIKKDLGIDKEESFTKFFNCKEIVKLAKKDFPNIRMQDCDDSERNICKRINLEVEFSNELGYYLGGISTRGKDEVKIIVILNKNFHPYRLVFWLVHEICHYLLNHPGSYSTNPFEFYKLRNSPEITRFETEAYLLTAEILIPRDKIIETLSKEHKNGNNQTYLELAYKFDLDPQQTGTILLREGRKGLVYERDFMEYKKSYYRYYRKTE